MNPAPTGCFDALQGNLLSTDKLQFLICWEAYPTLHLPPKQAGGRCLTSGGLRSNLKQINLALTA